MANVSDIAQLAEAAFQYFDKLFSYFDKSIKQSKEEKKAAEKIFKKTVDEIFNNLSILGNLRPDKFRNYTINSSEVRQVVNKDLKTEYSEQFYEYTKNFKHLKNKDKKSIIKKLSLAVYKINDMRIYAAKSTKELKDFRKFRPAVRLKNIRKVYDDIRKILASGNR